MRTKDRLSRGPLVAVVALALTWSAWPEPVAAAEDAAKLAPADTMLYVVIPSFKALGEKGKQTNYYALYKEPAMQPFVGPTEKKITEKINEGLSQAWAELGMEKAPEKLPWPQGRIVFLLRLRAGTRKIPMYRGDRDAEPEMREIKTPMPQVVALVDMGENVELARELLKKATDKAVEEGARRRRETIRGVEIETITEGAKGDAEAAGASSEPTPSFGFKGSTLIAGSDLGMVKDVLARMGGADLPSLADDPGLRSVRSALGGTGDGLIYFSAKALTDFIKTMADNAEEREAAAKMIRVLGFENVTGAGVTVELAPNRELDLRIKLQVAIRGEKTGIPALVAPASMSTRPGRLLTKGVAGFVVANYDASELYNGIIRLIETATGEQVEPQVQAAMEGTRGPGEGGRPPVNLKADVFGQLAAPVTMLVQINKPYTVADSSRLLLALGVRDGKVLDAALGRIHDAFIAQGNKEMRRELLNTNIYLLPEMVSTVLGAMAGGGLTGGQAGQNLFGFAVAGNQLVAGSLAWVEQSIRDLARDKLESIATDPMYQHAARFLPAQAGLFSYENQQIAMERMWTQLKEAAKAAAGGTGESTPREGPLDFQRRPPGPGAPTVASMATSPLVMLIQQLGAFVDFNALPEFSAVRKYFGAAVGHLVVNDEGLYLESVLVRPPPPGR